MTDFTPAETNIRENLEHFLQSGTMQVAISRRDVVHLLNLFKRLEGGGAAPVHDIDRTRCAVCKARFTQREPARVEVKGRGLMHGECADRVGIQWRDGAIAKTPAANAVRR